MEQDLQQALATLDSRGPAFRDQIERMRAFKERMKDAGVEVTPNKFEISLTGGTAFLPRRVLTRI